MEISKTSSDMAISSDNDKASMELTLSNINALKDLPQAFDFAIYNEIPIDGLDTIEEMEERFIMHLKKEKGKKRKLKVPIAIYQCFF